MRTLQDIKDAICVEFMRNKSAVELYGFSSGDNFTDHFRPTSIENILFSVFAFAIWVLESIFEAHKNDVNADIEAMIPHRPKWYRDMTLAFMKDKTLIPGTDRYDTTEMSEAQIEAARVVKHAVADESDDASILTIKVAGEREGVRGKLDAETVEQLKAYHKTIKDAGVRINLVNEDPEIFNCSLEIYYDAMLTADTVRRSCETAIKSYVENLPFNGEYTNTALVDELQKIEGVVLPVLKGSNISAGQSSVIAINERYVPTAGYFKTGDLQLEMKAYE